jgi:uncharacterized protein (TIGR02466 family)
MINQNQVEMALLFPTPVGVIKERKPDKKELKYIRELKTRRNFGNKVSKNTYVLDTKELSGLKEVIQQRLNEYFQQVFCPEDTVKLKITQSWCNYSDGGEHHHQHSHQNSIISGVYYPQSDHLDDKLMFHTPLTPYFGLVISAKEYNNMNSKTWWLPAHTGFLLFFPSYLQHSVPSIQERTTTRISLSFNTFYTGQLGTEKDVTKLILEE